MTVYLLHFHRPLEHARHYIGFTSRPLAARLSEHASGHGARLMQVCRERGIGWVLARTWSEAPRPVERALKRHHTAVRLCPICSPRTRRALDVAGWSRKRLTRPRLRFEVPSLAKKEAA